MIKAERIQKIQKLKDLMGNEVYYVSFKSGGRHVIPQQGVGLVSFLEDVQDRLEEVKAYLIVDSESSQVLAACLNQGGSWINLAFVKERDERQARGLGECLERLQGLKKKENA